MISTSPLAHIPIMLGPILEGFQGASLILDGTFGAGGHSRAMLLADQGRKIIALDRDPNVQRYADQLMQDYSDRVQLHCRNFDQMQSVLKEIGVSQVDGVLLDIGISSMHVDQAERGFSFMQEGPLDMRMGEEGETAADVVNTYDEPVLRAIIRKLGEEEMATPIVRNIVRHRAEAPIKRTTQLRDIIHEVKQRRGDKIDPATKTFQAIRLHVNDELGALERGLSQAEKILKTDGVLAVISFHSLEDRIVKRFLKKRSEQVATSRHLPPTEAKNLSFSPLHKGVLKADEDEISRNPRARSAKLRMARKLFVPDLERMN